VSEDTCLDDSLQVDEFGDAEREYRREQPMTCSDCRFFLDSALEGGAGKCARTVPRWVTEWDTHCDGNDSSSYCGCFEESDK
jgi:hypothetical protein